MGLLSKLYTYIHTSLQIFINFYLHTYISPCLGSDMSIAIATSFFHPNKWIGLASEETSDYLIRATTS